MARRIKIFDTTLRDGEQSPGCTMYPHEKLELARQLQRLGVDVIEAGFAASSEGDFNSISQIARTVKGCGVASLSRALQADIDLSYQAVRHCDAPRIHVFLATSPLHMQHKLKKTPEQVLELIKSSVSYAKTLCSDIEFSAEDFARSDLDFAVKALSVAISAGATVVNCPDTVGYCTPEEMFEKVRYLMEHVSGIERAEISAHNHNDLGLAVANSLAMVRAGASQIECTINGIGERAGNTSLEEVVMGLAVRQSFYDATTNINTKELYKASRLVSRLTGVNVSPTKAIVGANAFAHESGIHQHGVLACPETYEIMRPQDIGIPDNKIVLGKHSGKHAFLERISALGYELNSADQSEAFARFKQLCDKKKIVSDLDIEALLTGSHVATCPLSLVNYKIKCGKKSKASASVVLCRGNEVLEGTAEGKDPIDTAYKALAGALGREFDLDDFSINSVTEGVDAMAQAQIRLSFMGRSANGIGVSTDVIEASIYAYIDAAGKLI